MLGCSPVPKSHLTSCGQANPGLLSWAASSLCELLCCHPLKIRVWQYSGRPPQRLRCTSSWHTFLFAACPMNLLLMRTPVTFQGSPHQCFLTTSSCHCQVLQRDCLESTGTSPFPASPRDIASPCWPVLLKLSSHRQTCHNLKKIKTKSPLDKS
jgi:hypothetical protein